tara:strand:+ start:517 stop:666 length:150 start_codon:yes stop_codon:yes gene_type:complete
MWFKSFLFFQVTVTKAMACQLKFWQANSIHYVSLIFYKLIYARIVSING